MSCFTRNCRAARSISVDVAAVAVDDDELLDPGAMHALADLDEGAQRRLGRERERAAKRAMLVRRTDRLHRQEHRAGTVRQQRAHAREIGLRDVGIDADRKMRPVLLHGRNRQYRDAVRGEFLGRQ